MEQAAAVIAERELELAAEEEQLRRQAEDGERARVEETAVHSRSGRSGYVPG